MPFEENDSLDVISENNADANSIDSMLKKKISLNMGEEGRVVKINNDGNVGKMHAGGGVLLVRNIFLMLTL